MIVTNTGRTPGTILDISRQTDNGTRMEVCIPDVDKDGAFAAAESEKAVKLLHDRAKEDNEPHRIGWRRRRKNGTKKNEEREQSEKPEKAIGHTVENEGPGRGR